jgi:carbonic anhydrase
MKIARDFGDIRFDLGIRQLFQEWKNLFHKKDLKSDVFSGLTVACVNIPLSLALALASDVNPSLGLITAVISGLICGLFGGTPLAISGPANVLPVIVATVVESLGFEGVLIVGMGCGILQIITGALGMSRLIKLVPFPVITGFTAGIGTLILISQIPRALGLTAAPESHISQVILHIHRLFEYANPSAVFISMLTLGIVLVVPRFFTRIPSPLIAMLFPTALVSFLNIPLPIVGSLPKHFPIPHLPNFPSDYWSKILVFTLLVYALASLETLLSTTSADRLTQGRLNHDPDQELIGQGLGNIISISFGGLPITGVIARTALNIQSGAKTRRSSIFQSLLILLVILTLGAWIERIPYAVLAGIGLSIGLRMMNPKEFMRLWQISRTEAAVYGITFFSIVFFDLISGIQTGLTIALLIAVFQLSKTETRLQLISAQKVSELTINGPLTFLASAQMEKIAKQLKTLKSDQTLLVDLSQVESIDATGAQLLIETLDEFLQKKNVILFGLKPNHQETLIALYPAHPLNELIAQSETEMLEILNEAQPHKGLDRLLYGVEKFRRDIQGSYDSLFKKLATTQSPHTLFITCSDSRINPNLITSTNPGELFIVRNVGNIIPAYGGDDTPAEGAAVEFALGMLQVKDIIVCGHSECGAMKAILTGALNTPENEARFPSLVKWLKAADPIRKRLKKKTASPRQVAELNAVIQLENLKTYPLVKERLAEGHLRLHAWYYNIGDAELEEWDETQNIYVTIGSKTSRQIEKQMESGVQFQVPYLPHKKPWKKNNS